MQTQIISVDFHKDKLQLIDKDNEPMVPMKPIVENMGLDWSTQRRKLAADKERWGMVIMTIPSQGGDQETVCLPIRKIASWLMTISPNKVAPELRDKITLYQNECDDVLWDHWSKGGKKTGAVQIQMLAPRDPTPIIADGYTPMNLKTRDLVTLQQQKYKIMRQIEETESPAVRAGLYSDLRRMSDALGTDVPELDAFAFPKAQKPLLIED
ncbi:phage antirepressor N-terminal domain-containing protein [Undibacterium sp. TC9W]|uniref:phage antirepressor N-terminal domain-containing protein n=1 Tax=Undibacterium sp. TC9W TaxID=3413053 RepID=UPI003BF06406